jgi:hypothetical protein
MSHTQQLLPLLFKSDSTTVQFIVGEDPLQTDNYKFAILISDPNLTYNCDSDQNPIFHTINNDIVRFYITYFRTLAIQHNINNPKNPNISIFDPSPQYSQNSIILYI